MYGSAVSATCRSPGRTQYGAEPHNTTQNTHIHTHTHMHTHTRARDLGDCRLLWLRVQHERPAHVVRPPQEGPTLDGTKKGEGQVSPKMLNPCRETRPAAPGSYTVQEYNSATVYNSARVQQGKRFVQRAYRPYNTVAVSSSDTAK
jgi:hypothetical protein